ncbi:MAG: flagellar basal-body rod protein FlgF [Gammaproteobacteria bacterium]
MDRLLYVAMTGASQTMLAQAANSHNLANVSTTGFRADLEAFRSLPVYGPGYPGRVYAMTEGKGVDFSPGSIITTGRDLDVAVNGSGWIAVQAPDGTEAYTRAGDLRVTSGGMLVTGAGHPVLGNGGPIAVPPYETLEIGADGTISIRPLGQGAETLAVVDRIKLVDPPLQDLEKGQDGFLRLKDGVTAFPEAHVQLVSGALESSNVNAVDAMVRMIELARQFELQVKTMKTAEENDAVSARVMQLG